MRPVAVVVLALALAGPACGSSGAEDDDGSTLRVAAASSLTEVFTELAATFEDGHRGVDVALSFGGSTSLVTQLRQGAPIDVLATADEASMAAAVDAGLVVAPRPFAGNRLTLLVERGNPLGLDSPDDLGRTDVVTVLCAPEVPCGRLSALVLEAAGAEVTPRSREENVKGVVAKVALGEADAGLVYETDARAARADTDAVALPTADFPPLVTTYHVGRTSEAAASGPAADWIAFLGSPAAQRVLRAAGFLEP